MATPLDEYKEWLKKGFPEYNTIISKEVYDKIQGIWQHLKSLARYSAQLETTIAELLEVAKMAHGLIEAIAKHTDDLEIGSIMALMKVKEAAEEAIRNAEKQVI